MSVVITTGDKSKEYYLNQIGHVCCGSGGGGGNAGGLAENGLYLVDGKIVDGNGNNVTQTVDVILSESIVPGDVVLDYGNMIIDYGESTDAETAE